MTIKTCKFRIGDVYLFHATDPGCVEKAREFDPLGHAGFDPSGIIRLTP